MERQSLAAHIEELASQIDVRPRFLEEVRRIFTSKGISLEEDGAPYRATLEEVFKREETRCEAARYRRRSMAKIQQDIARLKHACEEHLDLLRASRDDAVNRECQPRHIEGVFRQHNAVGRPRMAFGETRSDSHSIDIEATDFQ